MRMLSKDVDWKAIAQTFLTSGFAKLPGVVSIRDCVDLRNCYDNDHIFRKRIVMERYNFGVGDYAYFSEPLPKLVTQLRAEFYKRLVPMANHMMQSMRREHRYPPSLKLFRKLCQEHGQSLPTPLMLHYKTGGINRLHRDLYGPTSFPLQIMVMLSQKGKDFDGGEFVLVENRSRQQSVVSVVSPDQGDLVIFPVFERPIMGKRGMMRATVRHGVSRVHSGERWVLGIIFHDAE